METEHPEPSPPGSRHAYWYAHCNDCGEETGHSTQIGGKCLNCAQMKEEGIECLRCRDHGYLVILDDGRRESVTDEMAQSDLSDLDLTPCTSCKNFYN